MKSGENFSGFSTEIENLNLEKRKDKKILKGLEFLLEKDDSPEALSFYNKRYQEVEKKVDGSIKNLKKLGFEKAVENSVRVKFAGEMLKDVSGTEDIAEDLKKYSSELLEKIEKNEGKFEVDSLQKYQELEKENNGELLKLKEEIQKQEKIVSNLQELISLDEDFMSEYVEPLNRATKVYEIKINDRDSLANSQAEKVLEGVPFCGKFLSRIQNFKDKIKKIENQEGGISSIELQWEILPPGEGPKKGERGIGESSGEWEKSLMVNERIDFLISLKPKEIYHSRVLENYREFKAFVFENHIIIASPWTRNAIFVMPRVEKWQEWIRNSKSELRQRGALRMICVSGWEERLKRIMESPSEAVFLSIGEPGDLGVEKDELKKIMKEKIFKLFPSIQINIERGKLEEAAQQVKKLKYGNFSERIISEILEKYDKLGELLLDIFPELDLKLDDFRIKKYKWTNATPEERLQNIREAIFSNYPEVKEAIEKGDYAGAKEWISLMTDNDLYDIGLRHAITGRIEGLGSRVSVLAKAFPELQNLEEEMRVKYVHENEEAKSKRWGKKFREAFLGKFEEVEEALQEGNLEKAKLLIIKNIREVGVSKFIDENIKSIRGVKGIRGKSDTYLKISFPEIDWAEVILRKKKYRQL